MPYYWATNIGNPIGISYWHGNFDCMSVGSRIRMLRRAKHLTQTDLEEATGIDQATLSQIENGAGFGAAALMRLAAALGTTAEQIMLGSDTATWPFPSIDVSRFFALDARAQAIVEGKLDAAIQAVEDSHPETKTVISLGQNVTYDSDKAAHQSHHVGTASAPGGRPVLVPADTAPPEDVNDRRAAKQREATHGKRSSNRKAPKTGNPRRA
jgi:transcriptional regulator with XRE-family HTH domain